MLLGYLSLLSLLCLASVFHPELCWCLQFHYANFSDMADILLVQEGSWYDETEQQPFSNGSAIWLTNVSRPMKGNYSMGRMVYPNPVPLLDSTTEQAVSFSTAFTFQLITSGLYGYCGSGFTFSITSFLQSPVNSFGGLLGLVNKTTSQPGYNQPFFAVEFDTFDSRNVPNQGQLSNDPSSSHLGIDINSLSSVNITDTSSANTSSFYPQLFLYNNYTFTCWIEYDSSTRLIRVWLTNSSDTDVSNRPVTPVVQYLYDLSSVFQEPMYLGFTSMSHNTSNCSGLGVVVFSWNFSSYEGSKDKSNAKLLLLILLPIFFGFSCFILLYIYYNRCSFRNYLRDTTGKIPTSGFNKLPPQVTSIGTPKMYSYDILKTATSCFSRENKIGEGAFSSVYKGVLSNGSVVAIKRLKEGLRKEAEFSTEMSIIGNIRHRNLLQLQGWCYREEEALLVYEFMSNGSLHDLLFKSKPYQIKKDLSDVKVGDIKMNILVDIASALEYLHAGLNQCILHRDIKAANVLLDKEFKARLADFGLARLIKHDDDGATLTAAGTAGYVAPEVFLMKRITDKADVYSFGVLMLVVTCGRQALNVPLQSVSHISVTEGDDIPISLVEWVAHLNGIDKLSNAIDKTMPVEQTQKWVRILLLALMCCRSLPASRPNMRQVHQMLQDCISDNHDVHDAV